MRGYILVECICGDIKKGMDGYGGKENTGLVEYRVSGIRFKLDRETMERELREHFEDKVADLQRFLAGLAPEIIFLPGSTGIGIIYRGYGKKRCGVNTVITLRMTCPSS